VAYWALRVLMALLRQLLRVNYKLIPCTSQVYQTTTQQQQQKQKTKTTTTTTTAAATTMRRYHFTVVCGTCLKAFNIIYCYHFVCVLNYSESCSQRKSKLIKQTFDSLINHRRAEWSVRIRHNIIDVIFIIMV